MAVISPRQAERPQYIPPFAWCRREENKAVCEGYEEAGAGNEDSMLQLPTAAGAVLLDP